ncbi:MAG: class I SAM-dependent methyltransferase [Planctomycetota bacterium]|jgi:SAM-dependent methyltransferase
MMNRNKQSMDMGSITAYDLPERVASYDADMEIMHPNRAKMVEIALQVLPFAPDSTVSALDLGAGTGYFTERFLLRYPVANIIAIDGAEAMVELAKTRLGPLTGKVDFRIGDFRRLGRLVANAEEFDVVYSSYALHHMNRADKLEVIKQALELVKTGGWFLNADLIVAERPEIEKRIQEIRVEGIVERARGKDGRFADATSTRAFLDELEANEGDQPLSLLEDLQVLKEAGLQKPAVFWKEFREAVTGGMK